MKRLILIIFILFALGCATIKQPPKTDYFREAEKAGLNIDTDSNNSVDAGYGGTNRTAVCSSGELLISDGTDYDCLGATPAGDLGGTWANPSVDDDSHDHVPGNIDLNEGQIIVGNGSSVGEATSTIPNLAMTVALGTDDTWSGLAYTANAGYTSGSGEQFQPLFLDPNDANNEWQVADADVSGDAPAWCVATADSTTDGSALVCMFKGCFRNDAMQGNWTDGDLLFLSDDPTDTDCSTDEGSGTYDCYGWTNTAPSTSTDVVQPLGRVRDNGSTLIICIDINPISGWATVP